MRRSAELSGAIPVTESGWILLRAWNDEPDALIFDLYPYASTSPVYVSVGGQPAKSPEDAEYFLRWIDRIIASAEARQDYNDAQEKKDTMDYLRAGRTVFEKRGKRAVTMVQVTWTDETLSPARLGCSLLPFLLRFRHCGIACWVRGAFSTRRP